MCTTPAFMGNSRREDDLDLILVKANLKIQDATWGVTLGFSIICEGIKR